MTPSLASSDLCTPDYNPQKGALVCFEKKKKNGSRKTLIHCCLISSIHENVTPSVLSPMISSLPVLLWAILRRPLSGLLVGLRYILRSCQNATVVSGCHQASFAPLRTLKKHALTWQARHSCPVRGFLFSMIFSSHSDCQGYYAVDFVSQLRCNRSF